MGPDDLTCAHWEQRGEQPKAVVASHGPSAGRIFGVSSRSRAVPAVRLRTLYNACS
jgi:hypothetical protein